MYKQLQKCEEGFLGNIAELRDLMPFACVSFSGSTSALDFVVKCILAQISSFKV